MAISLGISLKIRRGEVMTEMGQAIDHVSHEKILGIPQDIALVLAIDAVLISLRLSGAFQPNQFIGAKVVGTTALIAAHFFAFA